MCEQDKEEAVNFIPLILDIRIFSYSLPSTLGLVTFNVKIGSK